MLGQQVAPTEYDLRFRCFGFPVRVSPWFWATSAFIVWSDKLDHTLVGIVAVFLSILIHELGHAFAIRYYGGRSEIVLQFFGGYATCNVNPSRLGNIIISAAGPAAGFLLWGVLELLDRQFHLRNEAAHEYVRVLLDVLLWANWSWSLLNLLPVWPLDGGQIAHQVIGRFRTFDAWELAANSRSWSAPGIVSWHAFQFAQDSGGDRFQMIMFAILGFQNFQTLQASTRGRW